MPPATETRTTSAVLYLDAVSVSFDGFRADPDYALACAWTASEAGARPADRPQVPSLPRQVHGMKAPAWRRKN